jgi:hypothetical protein
MSYHSGPTFAVTTWRVVAVVSLTLAVVLAISGIFFYNGSLHNLTGLRCFTSAGVFAALSGVSALTAAVLNS